MRNTPKFFGFFLKRQSSDTCSKVHRLTYLVCLLEITIIIIMAGAFAHKLCPVPLSYADNSYCFMNISTTPINLCASCKRNEGRSQELLPQSNGAVVQPICCLGERLKVNVQLEGRRSTVKCNVRHCSHQP